MSGRGGLSSRAFCAALGALGGGSLLLAGGCAFIYDFEKKYTDGTGAGGGTATASGTGGEATASSGAMSGSGGAGGTPCMPHECGIELLREEMTDMNYGDISVAGKRVFWARDDGLSYRDKDAPPSMKSEDGLFKPFFVRHVAAETEDSVYFAGTATVYHYNVKDGVPSELAKSITPTGITVHSGSGFAYWPVVEGAMIYMGKPPNTVMPTNNGSGLAPSLISSSGGMDEVYWTFHGPMPDMTTGGVKRLNAGDLIGIDPQNRPTGIAADGEDVYWMTADGAIHKYTVSSQTVTDASPVLPGANVALGRVAVSTNHVYWLGPDEASCATGCMCGNDCRVVWRAQKTKITEPEKFASDGSPLLKGLAADANHVYWTTGGMGSKLLRKAH